MAKENLRYRIRFWQNAAFHAIEELNSVTGKHVSAPIISMRSLLFFLLLFTLPLLIRLVWALLFCPVPYLTPDELLYPSTAKLYIQGLASGNFSVLKVNAEHPPLSKLITALFIFLLGPLGFSDIGALRVQGCFFSSLTCILAYLIGSEVDRRIGMLSWFLLSLDPVSVRFGIASLDVTSLFFASLSIYMLLEAHPHSCRPYLLSGLSLGLATLCKYSAFPIVLIAFALMLFREKSPIRPATQKISLVAASSLALLVLGNPLFWPPQVIGFSGYSVFLEASSRYGTGPEGAFLTPLDWLEPALKAWNTPHALLYLSMFGLGSLTYPLPIFQSSYLPWLFLVSLLQSARRRAKLEGLKSKSLLWFSAAFLFFWFVAKSQAEPYYSVWLSPPLAIFSANSIIDVWRKVKR